MRIRKIELQNLNSLRGQHAVDFTVAPLDTAGIIAVTGETGSGKSTLLDAILLALYAETARKHQKEVVTYGQREAWAEVEFEVSGEIFRSRWEVKLKKSGDKAGEQGNAKMSLTKWVGDRWEGVGSGIKELTSSKTQSGLVEQVVGLSYEQFCKSVILPQGKFAEFFTAKEDDRAAILERLTNTEIYSQISIAAHERLGEAKQALEHHELRRGEMRIPTKQEISDWKTQEKELKEQLKTAQTDRLKLEQAADWFGKEISLTDGLDVYKKNLIELDVEQSAFAEQLQKLRNFERARPFIERYEMAKTQLAELNAEKSQLAVKRTELDTETSLATTHQVELVRMQTNLEELNTARKQLLPILDQVAQLDEQIRQTEALSIPIRNDVQEMERKDKLLRVELETETNKLTNQEPVLLKVRNWIAENTALTTIDQDYGTLQKQLEYLSAIEREVLILGAKVTDLDAKQSESAPAEAHARAQIQEASDKIESLTQSQLLALDKLEVTRDGLNGRIEELRAFEYAYIKVQEQQKRYRGTLREIGLLREKNETLLIEEEIIYRDLISFLDLRDELDQVLNLRKGMLDMQKRMLFIAEERAQLTDDQPCPVCGSIEHPDALHLIAHVELATQDAEQVQRKLEDVQQEIMQLQREARIIQSKLGQVLEDSEEMANAELLSLFQRRNDEEEELKALIENLPTVYATGAKEAKSTKNAIESETSDTPEVFEHIKTFVITDQALRDLQTQLAQYKQLRSRLETEQQQLDAFKNQLRTAEKTLQDHLLDTQATVTELKDKRGQLVTETAKLAAEQNLVRSKIGSYQLEDTSIGAHTLIALDKLRSHWSLAQTKLADCEKIQLEAETNKASLNTQIESLTAQHEKKSVELNELQKVLADKKTNRTTLFGEKDSAFELSQLELKIQKVQEIQSQAQVAQQEREKSMASLQAICSKMTTDLAKKQESSQTILAKLGGDMVEAGFELDTLPDFALTPEQAKNIEIKADTLAKTRHTVLSQIKETEAKLLAHRVNVPEIAQIELAAEQENLRAHENTLLETQGILRQRFDDLKTQTEQSTALQEQIEKAQQEVTRWDRLDNVIGSRDGAKFRKYAQGITLDNLVYHANRHLKRLFGRYQIARVVTSTRSDLQMEIVDTYQSDHRRTINTLSGGETFLISLAMALGLSDLAGQKTRIQSVFIDEGFGSLDPSTLDTAMEALENLQAEGVTVGIISHLPALHERIGTRIQVRKVGSGYSTIEVI
jgi:DNA repair protein SbcC/Rad50